jgi:hypothetical protein
MPKIIKRTRLKQTNVNKIVTVNSRTYGKHTRAARGSKKPAVLNDVLAAHAEKTNVINKAAKAVYDILKFYSEGFREGQLWQAILGRMRKAKDTSFENLLQTLEGLELNSRYTINRFGELPLFTVEHKKKVLNIKMELVMRPYLHKNDNCYQYTLIALLFDAKGACIQHSSTSTGWISKNEKVKVFDYNFEKPVHTKYCLFCLELKGGVDGVATNTLASKGMVIVDAEL